MINKKKILLLSSGDTFGAYEFIYRMAKFMEEDYVVAMVVRDKRKREPWLSQLKANIPKKKFSKRLINLLKRKVGIKIESFSTDPKYVFLPSENECIQLVSAESILQQISFVPDVIISGMTDGFLNTTTLFNLHKKTGAQVYQVMVDMNVITGGCHYLRGCEEFKCSCSNCPAITNQRYKKFTSTNFAIKKRNIEQGNFKLLAVPGLTIHQANSSVLYKDRTKIMTSSVIDTDVFTNINRSIAKQVFCIPTDARVIFAGSLIANCEIKGRKYLIEALSEVWNCADENMREKTVVLLAGHNNKEDEQTKKIQFKKILIEYITDYRLLSLLYQASDIFVCPSLEDGGPMMVTEALSCGTPVVGFETGVLFDNTLVQNGINGYHVKMKDSSELARAVGEILSLNQSKFNEMSNNARESGIINASKEAYLLSIKEFLYE